jgi:hypothetical protein
VLAVLTIAVACAGAQVPRDDDPLPLLRTVVTPEQLMQELGRVKHGALVQLPRGEFEARVRKAAGGVAQGKVVARVVRAHYLAELSEQSLVQGSGEWAVVNPGPGAAAPLPLAPLSVALSNAAWEDGRKAIIGDLDGKGLAAWVEGSGPPASLFFDWSCRGTPTPQGLTFDLRLPACPQTTVELRLPSDSWPAIAPRAGLLTGPHDAGTAGKRLWKLQLAGKTQIELTIRKVPGGPVPLFVQSQTRQTITPDRVAAEFDYQVEVPHDAVRELTFEGDARLVPYEVTARSAELTWRWDAPAGKGKVGPGTLVVEFREPQQGVIAGLRVRCLAPLAAPPAEWVSPGLRLRQAVCRAEVLKLQFHPDVHLGRWDGGDFHASSTATAADGGLTLTLVNARATLSAAPTRPRCQLVTSAAEFATIHETRWHIAPQTSALECEITYVVSRGQLHQVAVKLPTGAGPFHVDAVDVEPKGLLRSWTPAGPLLIVELKHGITPRTEARLRVRLSAAMKFKGAAFTLDVPDIEPLGAAVRDGNLAISLDPVYQAQLLQSSVAPLAPGLEPPAANNVDPAYAFRYRDQVLAGKLRLFAQRPRLHVQSRQEAILGSATGQWRAEVDIEPLLGRPTFVDAYLSAPLHEPWLVKATGQAALVHRVERLPVQQALPHLLYLGAAAPLAQAPLAQAALHLGLPRGELWRIHFASPVAQKTSLLMESALGPRLLPSVGDHLPLLLPGPSPWQAVAGIGIATRAPNDAATAWEIPVLSWPSVQQQEATVVVRAAGQRIEGVRSHGIEATALPVMGAGVQFRLQPDAPAWPWLDLTTRRAPTGGADDAVCESSELTTCMEADGSLSHLLRVRLGNWHEPRFTVMIPAMVQGLAAKVDGGWLDRLEAQRTPEGTRFVVPVNTAAASQLVELIYASAGSSDGWWLGCSIDAPTPQLPREPLVQRRFFRVPAGWVPLDQGRWRLRGEPSGVRDQEAVATIAERAWHAGVSLLPLDPAGSTGMEMQREDLRKAESEVRARLDDRTTLAEAIDRLATALPTALPLLIDIEGLRAAGRDPALPLQPAVAGIPFWEAVGLDMVACPSGLLLTTPQRMRQWQEQTGVRARLGEMLDGAVAEAAIHGLDHAGCFASVGQWLRMSAAAVPVDATRDVGLAFSMFAPAPAAGWLEWEPLTGLPPPGALVLFHVPIARLLGYLLATLWLVIGVWLGWRLGPATFLRTHGLTAGLLVLAVLWLPAPPRALLAFPVLLAEAAAFTVTFTLRSWPGRAAPRLSKSTMVRSTAVAVVCAAALTALPLVAQPTAGPEPQPVYLIPCSAPGQESALVAPELLRKLDEMAAQRSATPAGGVVVAARYEGKLKDNAAEVEARFELYHFSDKGTFVLPLKNVQFQPGVFLDGAPVFPVAHKDGYALPLRGKGWHQLTLTFQTRPALVNDLHELWFGIPRAGQCQLDLTWMTPTRGMYLAGGLGEQKLQLDKQGASWRAQLGHDGLVKVSWPAAQAPSMAGAVEVREAYYWDLRPQSLALTAGVQFTIAKGSLPQVRFALPDGLDVRQVELAARPPTAALQPGATLRQWHVTGAGAGRQLVIDFAQPVTGALTLQIEMVPRLALTAGQWLLRLPAPLAATSSDGILAYRVEGADAVASLQNLSVGAAIPPGLLDEAWAKLALRDPPATMKIVPFRRFSPAAALVLAVEPARPAAQADLHWKIGLRQADLAGRVNLVSAADDLTLVELELPPRFKLIRLGEAGGAPIHHWTRQDRLVQLWLQQPRRKISLEVRGWVEHGKSGPAGSLELAPVRVLHARSMASSITVEAESGLTVAPERLVNLIAAGKNDALRFRSDRTDYAATLALRAGAVTATGRAFTLLERHDDVVDMTTALQLQPQPGELRVAVSGWTGSDLRLESPPPVVRKGHKQQGADHVWTMQIPPGLPQTITLTLRGRFAAGQPMQPWSLPLVKLDRIALAEEWLGLAGVEPVDTKGITSHDTGAAGQRSAPYPAPPRDLPPGTLVAKLAVATEPLRVRIPAPAPSAQVLFAQHEIAWAGARWSHCLRLLTFASGHGELRVRLPLGARCRAVMVDGRVMVPAAGELLIPLSGPPGPRRVQVAWTYDRGEGFAAPRLDRPAVHGIATDGIQQRFWLPAAYELATNPAGLGQGGADLLLRQAEARMNLCRHWAEARPLIEDLRNEQQAFQRFLAGANILIARLQRLGEVDTTELSGRARRLAQENARLAEEGKYATPPRPFRPAAPLRPGLTLVENGLPICWRSSDAPALVSVAQRDEAFTRTGTELVALAAVGLLIITMLRRVLVLVHVLWPAILGGLAALGIALGGVTLLAVALVTLAAGLALLRLAVILQHLLPGWFAAAPAPPDHDEGPVPSPPAS